MRSCKEYETLISAFLDGELSGEERAETAAHLAACPACRRYFDDLAAIHDVLDREEAPLPEGFAEAVMARVRTTPQEGKEEPAVILLHWRRWAALAACCAFAALGLWVFQARSGTMRGASQTILARSAPSVVQDADTPACPEEEDGAWEMDSPLQDEAEEEQPEEQKPLAGSAGEAADAADGALPEAEYQRNMADAAVSPAAAPPLDAEKALLSGTVTAGGETARAWVESELGLPWESGRRYPLTAEQFSALLDALDQAGEAFQIEPGEDFLLAAE